MGGKAKKAVSYYLCEEVTDRLDEHCVKNGKVRGIFVEKAIKNELDGRGVCRCGNPASWCQRCVDDVKAM